MGSEYKTEQENFWAGDFGDAYIGRNSEQKSVASRSALFAKILSRTEGIQRVLELGANIGHNLLALQNLLPDAEFSGVEINTHAVEHLKNVNRAKVFEGSIFDFSSDDLGRHDLTFTSGVLIHINPERLPEVYDRLHACSEKYLLVNEYYNPSPVEVPYRGHQERLYKRDFAGELLDRFPDLQLVDYGFQYHRDPNFPADDANWFLLKKGS